MAEIPSAPPCDERAVAARTEVERVPLFDAIKQMWLGGRVFQEVGGICRGEGGRKRLGLSAREALRVASRTALGRARGVNRAEVGAVAFQYGRHRDAPHFPALMASGRFFPALNAGALDLAIATISFLATASSVVENTAATTVFAAALKTEVWTATCGPSSDLFMKLSSEMRPESRLAGCSFSVARRGAARKRTRCATFATGRTVPASTQGGLSNFPHHIVSSSYRSAPPLPSQDRRRVRSRSAQPSPQRQIVTASLMPRSHSPARGSPDAGSRGRARKLQPSQCVRPRATREVRVRPQLPRRSCRARHNQPDPLRMVVPNEALRCPPNGTGPPKRPRPAVKTAGGVARNPETRASKINPAGPRPPRLLRLHRRARGARPPPNGALARAGIRLGGGEGEEGGQQPRQRPAREEHIDRA